MAIEDAPVLADLLALGHDTSEALQRYESLRIPRTSRIVKQSRQFGRVGQWRHPIATGLRALAVRATPDFVMRQQFDQQIGYDATSVVG